MTWHILHTPMTLAKRTTLDGERWCFTCRKRRVFVHDVFTAVIDPDVPIEAQAGAWYGPSHEIRCTECGEVDGDCFPGTERDWSDV